MSLDDLIVRSRDLNSDLNSVSVAPNAASQSNTNDVAPMIHTLPRIDRDLTQVMEAGRRLWEQLGRPTEFSESDKVKAALVLNKTDTNFTLPSDNPKFQKLLKNTDLAPLEPCRDLDQLLSNERENAILALIENSEQAADSLAFETTTATILSKWNTEKTQLMQYFKGVNSGGDSWRDTAKNESRVFNQQNSFFNNTSISNLSMKEAMNVSSGDITGKKSNRFSSLGAMSNLEKTFASILKENVVGELLSSIINEKERLQTISRRMNNTLNLDSETNLEDIMEIWDLLAHVLDKKLTTEPQKVKIIHGASIDYLETRFRRHVENVVKSNQHIMSRNKSLPTTLELVRAYTSLEEKRGYIQPNDVQFAHVYYCLRMGDVDAAIEIADNVLSQAIAQWKSTTTKTSSGGYSYNSYVQKSNQRVEPATERQLLIEYKKHSNSQPYYAACLAALGCANVNDEQRTVANNNECWLWLKLLQIDSLTEPTKHSSNTRASYTDFQRSIIQTSDGQPLWETFQNNPIAYVRILLLSQQWERALEVLTRMGDSCAKTHAPHVALVLNFYNLLTRNSQIWNFGRSVINYCAAWQTQCPEFAIHYFYHLNHLPDSSSMGVYNPQSTLFHECIRRLIFEGVNDATFNTMFNRNNGEIFKLLSVQEAHTLFENVASSCKSAGRLELAVKLFEMASKYEECVSLLIDGMANGKHSLLQLAADFIERVGSEVLTNSVDDADSLFLVMDMTNLLSQLSSAEKMPISSSKTLDVTSWEIVNAITVVPMTVSKVEDRAESFRTKPEAIRSTFPTLLVAIMKLYVRLSSTLPDEKRRLREAANALVMFSGRVKYRTSASVNAQLVHLQLSV